MTNKESEEARAVAGSEGEDSWARREFAMSNIGDKRLDRRVGEIATTFYCSPSANVPGATGSQWSQAKATYRFLDNPKVTKDKILAPHKERTKERIENRKIILSIQDTSELKPLIPEPKGLEPSEISTNGGFTSIPRYW